LHPQRSEINPMADAKRHDMNDDERRQFEQDELHHDGGSKSSGGPASEPDVRPHERGFPEPLGNLPIRTD
jgi:hypothetical protein